MTKLILPAIYTVHAADKQKDTRHKTATINLLHEGTCKRKYLFSCSVIDAAAPTIQNIPIVSEDQSCAVGVIPEGSNYIWSLVLDNGVWRNYLQIDGLFWVKTEENPQKFEKMSGKFQEIEVELEIEGSEQDGIVTVDSFTVQKLRVLPTEVNQSTFTVKNNRYGALPKKITAQRR